MSVCVHTFLLQQRFLTPSSVLSAWCWLLSRVLQGESGFSEVPVHVEDGFCQASPAPSGRCPHRRRRSRLSGLAPPGGHAWGRRTAGGCFIPQVHGLLSGLPLPRVHPQLPRSASPPSSGFPASSTSRGRGRLSATSPCISQHLVFSRVSCVSSPAALWGKWEQILSLLLHR